MEVTQRLKDLVLAFRMTEVTDFVDEEEYSFYVDELNISEIDSKRVSKEFNGSGSYSINNNIVLEIEKHV